MRSRETINEMADADEWINISRYECLELITKFPKSVEICI